MSPGRGPSWSWLSPSNLGSSVNSLPLQVTPGLHHSDYKASCHGASTGLNEAVFWDPPPGLKQARKKKARKKKKSGKGGEEEGREQAGEKLGHRWEEERIMRWGKRQKGRAKWSLTVPTPRHSPLTGHTSSHTMSCTSNSLPKPVL